MLKFLLHETGTNSVADEDLDDGDHRAETIIFLIMKVTNTIQLLYFLRRMFSSIGLNVSFKRRQSLLKHAYALLQI